MTAKNLTAKNSTAGDNKTRRLTLMAMFAALAYLIMTVGRIPISTVSFLKYDPKDVMLVICGFVLGPMPALAVTTVVCLLEMVTVSSTGPVGLLMNLLSSAAFVCPAAALYRRRHSLRGAGIGLALGTLLMVGLMLLWNYFVTPLYMGYPRETVAAMLLPVFLPFNLIKGSLNAAVTILVYKPFSRTLKRAGLTQSQPNAATPAGRSALGATIVAVVLLASCILAVLVMKGII